MEHPPERVGERPPGFAEATNLRQRCRAAGLDPNYWYAVALEHELGRGRVREVAFQGRSIALYRGTDGVPRAVENRCAHRQLKLSGGGVSGCRLVCPYHGWAYEGSGRLAEVPHELFGRKQPRVSIRSFPVRQRYGLIWIFPGDPARTSERAIPDIPELEGPDAWACVPLSFTWRAHHSIIIDNVSDFTHAYLHRRFRPFSDARLTRCETVGDRVEVAYDTFVGGGRFSRHFVDRTRIDTSHIELCYDYPYQRSSTDDQIKHWLFVLPMDERTTRAFFLFTFRSLKLPGTRIAVPPRAMTALLQIANRLMIRPLLGEDGTAVEAEQLGYEAHWNAPPLELNPAVRAFQTLTVRKWREALARPDSENARAVAGLPG